MPYPDNVVTSNTVNTKMKVIANEVRELSGTSEPLGLDVMATNLGAANSEVDSQTELLAQAIAALEGKASGGGSVETVAVLIMPDITIYYLDGNMTMQKENSQTSKMYNVAKNTLFMLETLVVQPFGSTLIYSANGITLCQATG